MKPVIRPIAELLNPPVPPLIAPNDVFAVGTLDGRPWHASGHMGVVGPPPSVSRPAKSDYDFSGWLNGHEWHASETDGWWKSDEPTNPSTIVRFAPEWSKPGETGYRRNYLDGDYFTAAVRHGAVSWEMRDDGEMMLARDAEGLPVAIVACLRLPLGTFPE